MTSKGEVVKPAAGKDVAKAITDAREVMSEVVAHYREREAFADVFAESDSDEAIVQMMAAILAAEDVDEVLSPGASGLGKIEGIPIVIRSFKMLESDYEEGMPWYGVVFGNKVGDQREETWTCGAARVVAALLKLHEMSAFPIAVRVMGPRRTPKSGFRPLHLERAV